MKIRCAALSLLLLAAGCEAERPAPPVVVETPEDSPRTPEQDEAALLSADRAFARATAERGAAAWQEVFAEDGLQFDGAGGLVEGSTAIGRAMEPFFADSMLALRWQPLEARVSSGDGDLGFTHGSYEVVRREPDGSESTLSRGRYLTVWRRQPDGEWKVEADIATREPRGEEGAVVQPGPGV